MTNNKKNTGYITDAFLGALQKNEEMNNGIKRKEPEKKEEAPAPEGVNGAYITDAFLEALKINEELNKKYAAKQGDAQAASTPATNNEDSDADHE